MKAAVSICFGLFILGVLIGLAQLWFTLWTVDTFFKLLITDGAALAVVLAWSVFARERRDMENIRRGGRPE